MLQMSLKNEVQGLGGGDQEKRQERIPCFLYSDERSMYLHKPRKSPLLELRAYTIITILAADIFLRKNASESIPQNHTQNSRSRRGQGINPSALALPPPKL